MSPLPPVFQASRELNNEPTINSASSSGWPIASGNNNGLLGVPSTKAIWSTLPSLATLGQHQDRVECALPTGLSCHIADSWLLDDATGGSTSLMDEEEGSSQQTLTKSRLNGVGSTLMNDRKQWLANASIECVNEKCRFSGTIHSVCLNKWLRLANDQAQALIQSQTTGNGDDDGQPNSLPSKDDALHYLESLYDLFKCPHCNQCRLEILSATKEASLAVFNGNDSQPPAINGNGEVIASNASFNDPASPSHHNHHSSSVMSSLDTTLNYIQAQLRASGSTVTSANHKYESFNFSRSTSHPRPLIGGDGEHDSAFSPTGSDDDRSWLASSISRKLHDGGISFDRLSLDKNSDLLIGPSSSSSSHGCWSDSGFQSAATTTNTFSSSLDNNTFVNGCWNGSSPSSSMAGRGSSLPTQLPPNLMSSPPRITAFGTNDAFSFPLSYKQLQLPPPTMNNSLRRFSDISSAYRGYNKGDGAILDPTVVNQHQQDLSKLSIGGAGAGTTTTTTNSCWWPCPENAGKTTVNYRGNIFQPRPNFDIYEHLPSHKRNLYFIQTDDDSCTGNEDTRAFLLAQLTNYRARTVNCLACATSLTVYDHFPVINGLFFISPNQHKSPSDPSITSGLPITWQVSTHSLSRAVSQSAASALSSRSTTSLVDVGTPTRGSNGCGDDEDGLFHQGSDSDQQSPWWLHARQLMTHAGQSVIPPPGCLGPRQQVSLASLGPGVATGRTGSTTTTTLQQTATRTRQKRYLHTLCLSCIDDLVGGTIDDDRSHRKENDDSHQERSTPIVLDHCRSPLKASNHRRIVCRHCSSPWSGKTWTIGGLYTYDIFAASPCCHEHLRCNHCNAIIDRSLLEQQQRQQQSTSFPQASPKSVNYPLPCFSQYSQLITCPACSSVDYHFVKPFASTYYLASSVDGNSDHPS